MFLAIVLCAQRVLEKREKICISKKRMNVLKNVLDNVKLKYREMMEYIEEENMKEVFRE